MGQISTPATPQTLILTATDRLVASNADGGLAVGASHVILLGEDAGKNLSQSNVIGLGWQTAGGASVGGLSSVELQGSVFVGAQAGALLTSVTNGFAGQNASSIVMGEEALLNASHASALIVIGDGALRQHAGGAASGPQSTIAIGLEAMRNIRDLARDAVAIGWQAARGANVAASGFQSSVAVGSQAGPLNGSNTVTTSVFVGATAGTGASSTGAATSANTYVGYQAGQGNVNGSQNTALGSETSVGVNVSASVAVGRAAVADGNLSVAVGAQATVRTGVRSIMLGAGAGVAGAGNLTDKLLIETNDAGTKRTAIFADMAVGVVVLGNSIEGTNRDVGGAGAANLIKVLNGTLGAANPIGGGFLFCTAGELQFRSAGGVTYALTPGSGLGTFTFATLPAAPPAGSRAFINDGAAAPVFAAAAAGGGALFTPVYFSGAAWLNG